MDGEPSQADGPSSLDQLLAEAPELSAGLWSAYWGPSEDHSGYPEIVVRIADDILHAQQSRTALVDGPYGTGKSSFMKVLGECLAERARMQAKQCHCLWLHMPVLTAGTDSTPLASVMEAIVEDLLHEDVSDEELRARLRSGMDDLWGFEAGYRAEGGGLEPPQPNRMAGHVGDSLAWRFNRANTLEQCIDRALGWPPDRSVCRPPSEPYNPTRLVVFLDDLDRCSRWTAVHVVRLLLRFGPARGVHFILASDRRVMESGVREWMKGHGIDDDGRPIVTANSALEKYIHHLVPLPRLSAEIPAARCRAWLDQEGVLDPLRDRIQDLGFSPDNDTGAQAKGRITLADCLLNRLLAHADPRELVTSYQDSG